MLRAMTPARWWTIGLLAGCAQRAPSPPRDAGDTDVAVTSRDAADDGDDDAPTRVMTCSELRVREVTASPGQGALAYPGSTLRVRGDALDTIDRVSVGGVDRPFTRLGDVITTDVPPMLATGMQTVLVGNQRCMTSATITVSRLLADVPLRGGRVTLRDLTTLAAAGTLDTGLAEIAQATFTLDGTALVLRDADGRVEMVRVTDGRVVAAAPHATGAFALAQGNVVPTQGLLVVPSETPAGVLRLDSEAMTLTSYPGPAESPVGVATSLDGFRALVLDRRAVGYGLDRPFARTPEWTRIAEVPGVHEVAEVAMAQGGAVGEHGPLSAVYDPSDPPGITPMEALTGALGPRVEVPGAAGNVYFISGDVVAMDSTTNEVISVDITGLDGEATHMALEGESPVGVVRTRTALTLYRMGAVVLRSRASGVPQGDMLHVLDFHREPTVEERQVRVAGLRGVAGVPGANEPFIVWTAREILRVQGTDGEIVQRLVLDAGEGDLGAVVIHR